jgi:signal transduction histidine kinase/DNA-binding NarL/FixJ family response regulator
VEEALQLANTALKQRVEELSVLNQIAQTMATVTDLQAVLEVVAHEMLQLFDADFCNVALLDAGHTELRICVQHSLDKDGFSTLGASIPLDEHAAYRRVIETRQSLVWPQYDHTPMWPLEELRRKSYNHCLLIIPLLSRGRVIGTIGLGTAQAWEPEWHGEPKRPWEPRRQGRVFSPAEVKLAETIAGQVAGAIEIVRLLEEEHQQRRIAEHALREMELLYNVNAAFKTFDIQSGLERALGEYLKALGLRQGGVLIFGQDGQGEPVYLLYEEGQLQTPRLRVDRILLSHQKVMETKQPCVIVDALHDPLMADAQDLVRTYNIKSTLLVPFVVRNQVVGLLFVDSTSDVRPFTKREVSLAQAVADQIAANIFNIRLFKWERDQRQIAEQHLDELAVLNQVAEIVATVTDLSATLEIVAKLMVNLFSARNCVIGLLDEARSKLTVAADYASSRGGPGVADTVIVLADNPALTKVVEKRNAVIVSDPQHNSLLAGLRDMMCAWGVQCLMAIPLLARGEVIGVIIVDTTERGRTFTADERSLAETVAGQVASAVHNARLFDEVQRRAEEMAAFARAAEDARRAAEAANRAKSIFLANMSHELRTPLNAILGFTQLMIHNQNLTPAQRENLDIIWRSGKHLLALINDVLELSKIEAGRTALYNVSFDLDCLLADLEAMFRLRVSEKDLWLVFERAPHIPRYVRADENKLRQVLINLLGNAVKFTEVGGVKLRVRAFETSFDDKTATFLVTDADARVATRSASQLFSLEFEVKDTGPGIAPEELDAVFDAFVQTTTGLKAQQGTGLGLPLSRQFVNIMGGELFMHSELGVGTTFVFNIPVTLATADEVEKNRPERRVIALEPDQPIYRLLIVEDEDVSRKLLVKLLEPFARDGEGFEIREAVNGQQAVEICKQWRPDFIWMDIRMPILNGLEAARRIKSMPKGEDIIIVALTAGTFFEKNRERILSEGCDDFVHKPFKEADILDKLCEHLGVRFIYAQSQATCEGVQPLQGRGDQYREFVGKGTEDFGMQYALGNLSVEWLAMMDRATVNADFELLMRLVEQIRGQKPEVDAVITLADKLLDLLYCFDYDAMRSLLGLGPSSFDHDFFLAKGEA